MLIEIQTLVSKNPSIEKLADELLAWNESYNKCKMPINWQFALKDARIKLKRLYPDIEKFRKARDELATSRLAKNGSSEEGVPDEACL